MFPVIDIVSQSGLYARATIRDKDTGDCMLVETTPHVITVLTKIMPRKGHPAEFEGHATTRARANRLIRAAWGPDASVNRYQRVYISNVAYARYDVVYCALNIPAFLSSPASTLSSRLGFHVSQGGSA